MGKHSRNKGASFERQIAASLRELWPKARRRGNAQADGRPPLLIVKADRQAAMVLLDVEPLGLVSLPLDAWIAGVVPVDAVAVIWRD